MKSRIFDMIIIGHGLAGAILAWTLRSWGKQVLVIDAESGESASAVAAGLMTPLSGPKLVPSWGWEKAWPKAAAFYREVERQSGAALLYSVPGVRLFASREEQQRVTKDYSGISSDYQQRDPMPPLNSDWFYFPGGAVEMPVAARLLIPEFLAVSRKILQSQEQYAIARIDPSHDLEVEADHITIPALRAACRSLVFCQGYVGHNHPYFSQVRFNPAKGQMLTIRAAGVNEQRVIHQGMWLAPAGADLFRAGATFEWDHLDTVPTAAGRLQLLGKLKSFVRAPVEVVDQQAAVRPTMQDFRPVIGTHPYIPRIAILNGLGTKGSLWAPWLAELLAAHLVDGAPIPSELDVKRWFR